MNIGLIDVDGHNFPNFALMRASAIPSILVSLACVGSTSYKVETVAEENQINGKCGLFINN